MSLDCCVAIPRGAMGSSAAVIVVFPDHTHLIFYIYIYIITLRCHILIKRVLLLSPYLCFISLLYLDLYVLGDDALIS